MNKVTATIIGMAVGLVLTTHLASADNERSPPLSMLTAEWRQWAYSIPTGQNPQEDPTGQFCMVGQRGPIWFLAGVFLGGTAERSCTVPEGTALFFPVINQDAINAPNVCGDPPENTSVRDLRAQTKAAIDSVTDLSVEVDGKNVKNLLQRIKSTVYEIVLPEDNVFDAPCGSPGVPGGIYSPAVDDGYYVLLHSLKPGVHTIHFEANDGFENVTYKLTVTPILLK